MIPKSKIQEFLIPNLLVFPMVSHWILPSGAENHLYISMLGFLFYIPDICYLLYTIYYSKLHIIRKKKYTKKYGVLLCILLLYVFVLTLAGGYSSIQFINVLLGDLTFIYLPLIFLLFPLDWENAQKTKYLLCFSLVFISLQIMIYGLGILSYTSATGDDLTANEYDIGGVFRVSTTVGASTGTGLIIAMLGILIAGFYELKNYAKISLLMIATIALLFSLSRGPLLLWGGFLAVYVLRLFRTVSIGKKIFIGLFIIGCYYTLDHYGVFEPLRERMEFKSGASSTDMSSGRGEFNKEAIDIFLNYEMTGVGPGRVFPEKQLQEMFKNKYTVRMHNTYLVYLSELGIIGGGLVLLFYLIVILSTDFKRTTLGWGLLLILLLSYNLESVFIMSEYLGLTLLIIVLCQRWNINKMIKYKSVTI